LRWAGSKRQVLTSLGEYWSASGCDRYVEPFAGSAALFFSLEPTASLLSDINPLVALALSTVRDTPGEVHKALSVWASDGSDYYSVRGLDSEHLPSHVRVARLIYLMRFCYGGIYRVNRSGVFNVPAGGARTGRLPTVAELTSASIALSDADIRCGDFEKVLLAEARSGDFVYLDPPYALKGRRSGQYGADVFEYVDADRLARLLVDLDKRGCSFVLSYADAPDIRERFERWHRRSHTVQRLVARKSEDRKRASELLLTNIEAFS
jgi:DNA adenine methylase